MFLKLHFENTTFISDIVRKSFNYTQNYHNNLQPADNFVRCVVPYNEDLSDLLKLQINNAIKCEFVNEDNSVFFTGYLKKNVTFSKITYNKSIEIEVTSGTYLFDKTIRNNYAAKDVLIADAVSTILDMAGVDNYDLSNLPEKTIKVFTLSAGETIKEALKNLLFEYGFIYDFDETNQFVVHPLFNLPEHIAHITQEFTDGQSGNVFGTLKEIASEKNYDGVSATYENLEYAEAQLIFNDADTHEIQPNGYLYDNESGCYTEYDSSKGAVRYIDTITTWKVKGSDGEISPISPSAHGLSGTFQNLRNEGLLTVKNTGSSVNTVSSVQVYGSGYFATSLEQENTVEGDKPNEITLKYISNKADAKELVENLTNYYRYASFKVELYSKTIFDYGSFVLVSAEGMGTIAGRVTQKVINLESKMIKYTIEAIDLFSTIELESVSNRNTNNNPTIEQVETIVQDVAEPIVREVVGPIVDDKVSSSIVKVYPRYIGAIATMPDHSLVNKGDWFLYTVPDDNGNVHLYINNYDEDTDTYSWDIVEYSVATDYMFTAASKDILNYTADTGEVGQFASLFVSHLFSQKITIANGGYIESENYSEETISGFRISSNGEIIANKGWFRGVLGNMEFLCNMDDGFDTYGFCQQHLNDEVKFIGKFRDFNTSKVYYEVLGNVCCNIKSNEAYRTEAGSWIDVIKHNITGEFFQTPLIEERSYIEARTTGRSKDHRYLHITFNFLGLEEVYIVSQTFNSEV